MKTTGQKIARATIDLPLDLKHEDAELWLSRRIDAAIRRAVLAERKACIQFAARWHPAPNAGYTKRHAELMQAAKARDTRRKGKAG